MFFISTQKYGMDSKFGAQKRPVGQVPLARALFSQPIVGAKVLPQGTKEEKTEAPDH
jgi:hypothetical protein